MNRYVVIDRQKIKGADYVYTLVNYNDKFLNLNRTDLISNMRQGMITVRNMKIETHGRMYLLKHTPFKISRLDKCKKVDKDKIIYNQIMMLTKIYLKPLEELPGNKCKIFNLGYSLDSPISNELYEVKFAILHNNIIDILKLTASTNDSMQLIFEAKHKILNTITSEVKLDFNLLYDANTDMHKLISDTLVRIGIDPSTIRFY